MCLLDPSFLWRVIHLILQFPANHPPHRNFITPPKNWKLYFSIEPSASAATSCCSLQNLQVLCSGVIRKPGGVWGEQMVEQRNTQHFRLNPCGNVARGALPLPAGTEWSGKGDMNGAVYGPLRPKQRRLQWGDLRRTFKKAKKSPYTLKCHPYGPCPARHLLMCTSIRAVKK